MPKPRYLIDSNICIYLLGDAHSLLSRRVASCVAGTVAISSISYAEVALGIDWNDPLQADAFHALAIAIPVLPFDAAAAISYAQLPFRRGTFDRLIGAHCVALGLTLVTNNEADFADITDLRIENWTK